MNTPQAKLFIGKMRSKKPNENSDGYHTNHIGIFFYSELNC